ncbi:MAG: hypothetical protein ACLFQG_10225 [Desulfovermiculus sp.]
MTAFFLGVNSYVHPEDVSSLETILDRAQVLFEDQRHMWLTAGKGHETGT